jgi:hypothetical protein
MVTLTISFHTFTSYKQIGRSKALAGLVQCFGKKTLWVVIHITLRGMPCFAVLAINGVIISHVQRKLRSGKKKLGQGHTGQPVDSDPKL